MADPITNTPEGYEIIRGLVLSSEAIDGVFEHFGRGSSKRRDEESRSAAPRCRSSAHQGAIPGGPTSASTARPAPSVVGR